jgi:hypothetical protein
MGEYERMVIDFTAIVVAPHLGALVLVLALAVLVAVVARVVARLARVAIAPMRVLSMVAALAATVSKRIDMAEARARAPSALEFFRV